MVYDSTQQIKGSALGTHVIARDSRPTNLFLTRTDALDRKQGSLQAGELLLALSLSVRSACGKQMNSAALFRLEGGRFTLLTGLL